MRGPIARWVALISQKLPDLSRVPQRRQIVLGLAISVLLHVVIFGALIVSSFVWPHRDSEPLLSALKAPLREVDLQLIPPAPPAIAIEPAVFDAKGLEEAKAAPERPVFQSSQDMVAGSDLPARGQAPVPTQKGIKQPTGDFKDQAAVLAKVATDSVGEKRPPQKPAVAAPPPAPKPAPPAEPQAPVEPRPEPPPAPPNATQIALYPKKTEPPREVAMLKPPAPRATEPQRAVPPSAAPGSQAEMRKSEVEGSISNRGRPGVDAVKTPYGVYRQKLSKQVQARWQYYTKQRMDTLAVGTVRVRFFVTQSGRVESFAVLDNNSNSTFANICEQSVREAEVPAPPSDLDAMKDGRMEMIFTFTLY